MWRWYGIASGLRFWGASDREYLATGTGSRNATDIRNAIMVTPTREEDATTKPKLKAATAADDEMSTTEVTIDEDGPDGPGTIEDLEDIDDIEELADLEDGEDTLDDDDDDALGDDALDVDEASDVVAVVAGGAVVAPAAEGAAEAETDDDELLADEVEASLDVILAERLRGEDSEADEDLEDDEEDAPNQLATVIPVRRPDEFLCQSCFLLKPPGQLADADHQLCRDCA